MHRTLTYPELVRRLPDGRFMLDYVLSQNDRAFAVRRLRSYVQTHTPKTFQDVSEFIQAAGSLPASGFLGIQINADKDRKHRVYAFSGPDVDASAEDFNWLLQKCASAEIIPQAPDDDTWGKERRIYVLRYMPGSIDQDKDSVSHADYKYCHKHYKELFEALGGIGGSIRIITSAENGGSCTILVSLPSEMTLRMRAMLSFAFLNTKVIAEPIGFRV